MVFYVVFEWKIEQAFDYRLHPTQKYNNQHVASDEPNLGKRDMGTLSGDAGQNWTWKICETKLSTIHDVT